MTGLISEGFRQATQQIGYKKQYAKQLQLSSRSHYSDDLKGILYHTKTALQPTWVLQQAGQTNKPSAVVISNQLQLGATVILINFYLIINVCIFIGLT